MKLRKKKANTKIIFFSENAYFVCCPW